ncbi:ClpP/crotonase-like domain-containing protein [Chytriomyces sp. MP71]|nr:ClpP/crotonase-like domain-containing protein [Chytriomyces sp. MP71]
MAPFVRIDEKRDYAIVTIHRGPVNAMNLQMWEELQAALDRIEGNPKMRGLIFCSGLEKDIFTAGNDLSELYAPMTSLEGYTKFWTTQNVFIGNLYQSGLVTVSAIRGACPAGGCAISLACDYRIMSQGVGHIGLNEPQIGLMVPPLWMELFAKVVGERQAEMLGFNGSVVSPEEAKRIGLVDLLAPKEKLLEAAEAVLQKWLKIPSFGRSLTKKNTRADLGSRFADREALKSDSENGWMFISSPQTVKAMKATMDRLAGQGAKL